MSRHSGPPWWRRLFLRPSMRQQAKRLDQFTYGLEAYELAPGIDNRIYPVPTPLGNRLPVPTEGEIGAYVADITDPDLGLPPLDPPLDETRFDLIRVHPYLKR